MHGDTPSNSAKLKGTTNSGDSWALLTTSMDSELDTVQP